jgi:type III pantothenate kinase
LILADIGNRHAHLKVSDRYFKIPFLELLKRYKDKRILYISVNSKFNQIAKDVPNWIDISQYVDIRGSYQSMGVDRKALLLSRGDGVYIDAGSAITVDVKIDNRFIGGVILAGIWRQKQSYKEISQALKVDKIIDIDLNRLPDSNTQETISYGIIAPIVALIERINNQYRLPIYITGGDGKLLSRYLNGSIYKEDMVFEGLEKVVKLKKIIDKE